VTESISTEASKGSKDAANPFAAFASFCSSPLAQLSPVQREAGGD
jgi:hypothetical protein